MRGTPKNDAVLLDAIRASNDGHHLKAASLYQKAGNQMRDPAEKADLWKAAERAKRTLYSD